MMMEVPPSEASAAAAPAPTPAAASTTATTTTAVKLPSEEPATPAAPTTQTTTTTMAVKLTSEYRPSALRVHSALITGQVLFGGGSVVGKLGVATFNPMMFALIREAVAGVLLMLWAIYQDGWLRPKLADTGIFLACGIFIFTNQACFIVGDKLAGAVIGSAWQPTQPVFTLLISILLRWEKFTIGKGAGILISFGGAAFMVVYGADFGGRCGSALGRRRVGVDVGRRLWRPLWRPPSGRGR